MSRRSIGGMLDLAALALLVGGQGRQYLDRDELRAAAHELRARGLTPAAIATSLCIAEASVRALLGEGP